MAAGAQGGIYSYTNRNEEIDNHYVSDIDGKMFSVFANYSLGYYPNTRTNIQVAAEQQIMRDNHDSESYSENYNSENRSRSTDYRAILRANLYYYFSPNLRLTGSCGITYTPNRLKGNEGYYFNSNNFSSFFNAQLTYFIF